LGLAGVSAPNRQFKSQVIFYKFNLQFIQMVAKLS